MANLVIKDEKLYLIVGKQETQLSSAAIHHYPLADKRFNIDTFTAGSNKRKTFRQKYLNLTGIPLESRYVDDSSKRSGMTEIKYAHSKAWYVNYYKY